MELSSIYGNRGGGGGGGWDSRSNLPSRGGGEGDNHRLKGV